MPQSPTAVPPDSWSSHSSALVASSPTSSVALAAALLDGLILAGLDRLVFCPGSRSAPLVYAAADRPTDLAVTVRLDERSGAFMALGMAMARPNRPVGLVTTSGTAAANPHPAVLEASHAGLALIVLTADRPAELRLTGANQTTEQRGLFAQAVRREIDLSADSPLADWRAAGQLAGDTATGHTGDQAGPVHLNLPFREPLHPSFDLPALIARRVSTNQADPISLAGSFDQVGS